jgi:hypothetical protein
MFEAESAAVACYTDGDQEIVGSQQLAVGRGLGKC